MSSSRVLIVDSDVDPLLEPALREAGFDVQLSRTAREGHAAASVGKIDLILLDIALPDVQGTEICRMLKGDPKTKSIPIIVATASSEEIDRVVAFELGADDYVAKPFSVRELVLRMRAVLRRWNDSKERKTAIRLGPILIEPETHRVWVNEGEVVLTALEFKLLMTLASSPSRISRRQSLLSEVWGVSLHVETRTIDTHVKRLREKLGPAGALIKTVRGVGYRFVLHAD